MNKQTTMKAIKALTATLCMLFLALSFTSCGDDKDNNEPDNPANSIITENDLINPDILPGTWILESFTDDESGKTTSINKEFTILPFNVKQESDVVAKDDGYEFWAEIYDSLTSSNTVNGEMTSPGIVGFRKKVGSSLKEAKVYELSLTIHEDDGIIISVCTSFSYKDGVLTCKNSSCISPSTTSLSLGTVKLKKI